jgi:hypothetical protein
MKLAYVGELPIILSVILSEQQQLHNVARSPTQYQSTLISGQKMKNFRIMLLAVAMGLLLLAGKCTETLPCLAGQVWGLLSLTVDNILSNVLSKRLYIIFLNRR